ncbi:Protein of unknown function [Flavobacterium micromati]|uniref:DUF2442 domain-containing protein n=1 Tax=Flavobacterium micromati TaxID=229205 RepID=A0A1M5LPA1_9FLAO|nr:DUF2442 domain-containing protein [Flavobacterium micromati]MCL6460627.1 DUF2442 domain-containing protein [Flavobacterium micromati]SHG66917.1 Protein of unknown function [Flavobacterium micromati]
MSFSIISKSKNAIDIVFSENKMIVYLEDGRELAVPLEWFPRLRKATSEQLKKWRFIGKGEGVHWEEIDEDISIKNLLE